MDKLAINIPFIRGQFYARKVVPDHLRGIIGKRELKIALGSDQKTARKKAYAHLAAFEETLEAAEKIFQSQKPTLSSAAKAHYALEIEFDTLTRAGGTNTVFHELFDPIYVSKLKGVVAGIIVGDEAEALIGYAADDLIEKKLANVRTPTDRLELLKVLASVRLDSLSVSQSRDAGTVKDPTPSTPQLHEPDPLPITLPGKEPAGVEKSKTVTISKLAELFNKEHSDVADSTKNERVVAIRMFREFLGSDKPAAQITDDDVIAYKDALLDLPANYQQRFPGMTLPQAIKANRKRAKPFNTLGKVTINAKWLMHLGTIFRWAVTQKLMKTNPAQNVKVATKRGASSAARTPFTPDELAKIFSAPLFREERYGSRQWALLLALYTAGRSSSELRRIELREIYKENGIDIIHFGSASKNRRSKRIVPVHSDLIALGFLEYVEDLRRQGKTVLFEDWEPEDKINRWVNRTFLPGIGVKREDNDFYTLRHTMKTAMARAGVSRDIMDLICGHEDQSAGGVYIADQTVTMIQAMSENINRVKFGIINLIKSGN